MKKKLKGILIGILVLIALIVVLIFAASFLFKNNIKSSLMTLNQEEMVVIQSNEIVKPLYLNVA